MTHDELQQEGNTPETGEQPSSQGSSGEDAPPAKRRRTRKHVGTDAASSTTPVSLEQPEEQGFLKPTSSKEATTQENENQSSGGNADEATAGSTAASRKSTTRRRRAKSNAQNTSEQPSPPSLAAVDVAPASSETTGISPETSSVQESTQDVAATSRKRRAARSSKTPRTLSALIVSPLENTSTESVQALAEATSSTKEREAVTPASEKALPPHEASEVGVSTPFPTQSTELQTDMPCPGKAPLEAPSVQPASGSARTASKRTKRPASERKKQPSTSTRKRGSPPPLSHPPLEAPLEEPSIDIAIGAHIVERDGMPVILINGWAYPPTLFFGNLSEESNRERVLQEVRLAAKAGIHLHSTLIELPCPLSESGEVLEIIDQRLRVFLEADPEGFVMPRILFYPAPGWRREYPLELSHYADGTSGDPSITSHRFWQECERSIQTLIEHLRLQPWGERIFGYHLERGEWFQPADLGFDRSLANRDAFRDWLREHYQGNLIALRAAWFDSDVQFHTAEIPALPTKPHPSRAFFESRKDRRYIDFFEFTSESTAQRIIALARAVKRATSYRALVSVCYGYTFEFTHSFSGHLALNKLLAERCIDLICGPPSYRDRRPGGAASFPSPVDSAWLHGKLWLSEDDTKTHLATPNKTPDDFNPRLSDASQTEQAQQRTIGRALAHRTAVGWMDLWGEGWLNDSEIWERLKFFARIVSAPGIQRKDPEVVVLIDEKSLLHIQRGENFFRRFTVGMRDTLQRLGAEYGIYLQSDVITPNFPTDAKLYIFLNPFRLPPDQKAAIREKLQKDRKTLVWLYAPGTCEERPHTSSGMEETAFDAVGIRLRMQPWSSEMGSQIVALQHPITERFASREGKESSLEIGYRERLNPSYYVDDPDAIVLAEYLETGLPSIAFKQMGTWRSVFIGETVLPLELLRGLCRFAGVHLWVEEGNHIVDVAAGWICIHATQDGRCLLRLPAPAALYDLGQRRLLTKETMEHSLVLRTGFTTVLFAASLTQMECMGLPGLQEPPLLLEQEVDSPPIRAKTDLSPSVVAEALETLQAVLAPSREELGLVPPPTVGPNEPLAPLEEAGEPLSAGRRRRRRRGGRGRGKRRADNSPTAGDNNCLGEIPPVTPSSTMDGESVQEQNTVTEEGFHVDKEENGE